MKGGQNWDAIPEVNSCLQSQTIKGGQKEVFLNDLDSIAEFLILVTQGFSGLTHSKTIIQNVARNVLAVDPALELTADPSLPPLGLGDCSFSSLTVSDIAFVFKNAVATVHCS